MYFWVKLIHSCVGCWGKVIATVQTISNPITGVDSTNPIVPSTDPPDSTMELIHGNSTVSTYENNESFDRTRTLLLYTFFFLVVILGLVLLILCCTYLIHSRRRRKKSNHYLSDQVTFHRSGMIIDGKQELCSMYVLWGCMFNVVTAAE